MSTRCRRFRASRSRGHHWSTQVLPAGGLLSSRLDRVSAASRDRAADGAPGVTASVGVEGRRTDTGHDRDAEGEVLHQSGELATGTGTVQGVFR